jgi:hypothetical protein
MARPACQEGSSPAWGREAGAQVITANTVAKLMVSALLPRRSRQIPFIIHR